MSTLTVGSYELVKLLGEGGMGSVYEGRHRETGQRVAVKLINADVAAHSSVLARFEIEARAAAAIQSPHVTKVLDFGRADGAPYLVMEMLDGKDLETVFGEYRVLSPDLVIRFGAQCCAGLELAHDRGIVHRDIKPANLILAERDGSDELILKVLDFGIAKVRADEWQALSEEPLTRTGSLLGSPRYMSPEQARGYKTIDHRTDLFSLAVVMYQGLVGHTPHHKVEAMGDLIVTLCSEPAPKLRSLAHWIDPRLEKIISRALAINVAERYASASDMARDLNGLFDARVTMKRADLRTFVPPPLVIGVTATLPLPIDSPRAPEATAQPIGSTQLSEGSDASATKASATKAVDLRTQVPSPAKAATHIGLEREDADSDPFPVIWVAAGILLSLVVGIGSVAAGVIPLPLRATPPDASAMASEAGSASGSARAAEDGPSRVAPAASSDVFVAKPDKTGAVVASPPPSAAASATTTSAPSAKPALTGHMPSARPPQPSGPTGEPKTPTPAVPPPQPGPAVLPPDSPL